MQSTAEPIETGWHQFSIPPYPAGSRPRLYCWCGASVEMTTTGNQARPSASLERFLSEHSACPADEDWLMQRSA